MERIIKSKSILVFNSFPWDFQCLFAVLCICEEDKATELDDGVQEKISTFSSYVAYDSVWLLRSFWKPVLDPLGYKSQTCRDVGKIFSETKYPKVRVEAPITQRSLR